MRHRVVRVGRVRRHLVRLVVLLLLVRVRVRRLLELRVLNLVVSQRRLAVRVRRGRVSFVLSSSAAAKVVVRGTTGTRVGDVETSVGHAHPVEV